MKPVMKHIKINGHTCKKGRHWNMASFLPRRQRLALQAASSRTATDHPASTPNPTPQPAIHFRQEPETRNSKPETLTAASGLNGSVVNANPETIPQPALKHALPGQNPAAQIENSGPSPLRDLGPSVVDVPSKSPMDNRQSQFPNPPQEPETRNPKPETPTPLCDLGASVMAPSPRNGKIARLPDDIRFCVSQMIRSGRSYSDISAKLAELGHPGITPANISNWKFGGFVDWLTEEQRSDRRLVFAQALDRCTRSADIDRIQQNTIALAADKLAHIILDFDHERALALLTHQPELFPKFLAAIGTLSKSTVDLAKAFDLAQNREATIRSRSADIPVRTIAETSTENGDSTPDSAEQPNGPAPAPGLPRAEPLIEPTEVKNTALDFNRFKPILSDFSRFDTKPEHGKLKELQIDTL